MPRLTFEGNFCDIAMCRETPGCSFCEDGFCSQKRVWERLKAYEETGLDPEEVAELVSPETVEIARLLEKMCKEGSAQHMLELFQAEKDGRLVVLPCKVGDIALVKDRAGVPREMRMEAPDIRFVCTDEDNFCAVTCNRKPDGYCAYRIRNDGSDIGKTVFLTREEAEAALKGGDGI